MENKEALVSARGVSKRFCKDLKRSLWYGLQDVWSNLIGNDNSKKPLRKDEFWALRDINFELKRGECLGLIGHNGAGKSTLLKILNGLINPDEGQIIIKGKVGALIELGAGFNPILSGRENIYNNGAVLGFSREMIDEKVQQIIDFAELEDFIDMPVQNYSSGMKVRLGFAVAVQMQPDVLIIDEVLAVGDLGFVLKCFKTIDRILPRTALIFVSHNMPVVSRICNQIILLEKGEVKYQGENVSKGIDFYYNKFTSNSTSEIVFDDGHVELMEATIIDVPVQNNVYQIHWGDTIMVRIKIKIRNLDKAPYLSLNIYDKEQRSVAEVFPEGQDIKGNVARDVLTYRFQIKNLYLSKGLYDITLTASKDFSLNVYYKLHKALTIQVEHETMIWTPFLLDSKFIEFE